MNREEMDELVFLWEDYAKEDDDKLTEGAILLKKQVLEFVNELITPKFITSQFVKEGT